MSKIPDFNLQAAHKYFSVHCFNAAWEYIEKARRTPDDDDNMIRLTQTSMWHWKQREDVTDMNFSVGYWQLSRVYALAGKAEDSRKYGKLCLKHSENEEPFYKGFAHEAMARAEALVRSNEKAKEHIAKAREFAKQVADPERQRLLVDDIENIRL